MNQALAERLMLNIERITETGCWIWLAYCNADGYAIIKYDGKPVQAHRLAYKAFIGDFSASLQVLHRCDVPCCLNPTHLFLGTHADNMRDRESKGRANHPRGNLSGKSKLSETKVVEIKRMLKNGSDYAAIARIYSVDRRTVYDIAIGRTWSWLRND